MEQESQEEQEEHEQEDEEEEEDGGRTREIINPKKPLPTPMAQTCL